MQKNAPLRIELDEMAYEVLLSHFNDLSAEEVFVLYPKEERLDITVFDNGDEAFFVPLNFKDITIYVPFTDHEELSGRVVFIDYHDTSLVQRIEYLT